MSGKPIVSMETILKEEYSENIAINCMKSLSQKVVTLLWEKSLLNLKKMEPLMLAAATAVATTVMTKALEKTGEKLGEKVFDRSEQFLASLKQKSPETTFAIEKVQQPLNYGEAVLEVEALAKEDPEFERTVLELSAAVAETSNAKLRGVVSEIVDNLKDQEPTVQQLGKLAEKIGLVVYGGSVSVTNLNV